MGFYTLNQLASYRSGPGHVSGLGQDLEDCLAALNAVEAALGITATQWHPNYGTQSSHGIPHMVVRIPGVADKTYIRDAVDRLRSAGGAPAFPWAYTPGTTESEFSGPGRGRSERHILELKEAIGRIISTGTITSSYVYSGGYYPGHDFNYGEGNVAYTGDPLAPIDGYSVGGDPLTVVKTADSQYVASRMNRWWTVKIWDTNTVGAGTEDFENDYSDYVATISLPGGTPGIISGSGQSLVSSAAWVWQSPGGNLLKSQDFPPYYDTDKETYDGSYQLLRSDVKPTDLSGILSGGPSGRYAWVTPSGWDGTSILGTPTIGERSLTRSGYLSLKSSAGSRGEPPMYYEQGMYGEFYDETIRLTGLQHYLDSGEKTWLFWTEPILPANWPNDIYTG